MAIRIKYFAVIGSGAFPMDMLRYDRCWPVDSNDAANLTDYNSSVDLSLKRRAVVLGTVADRNTPDRWSSFGWTCSGTYADSYDGARDWVRSIMGDR